MPASAIETWYPEAGFGGFTDIGCTLLFYSRLRALVSPDSVVLDFGCGRAAHASNPIRYRRDLRKLRGDVRRVVGVDVDPAATSNPWIDEFKMIGADGTLPVESATCDAVFSDSVLEHVPMPGLFFAECARVLKPGGFVALRTTDANG
jgi:SAM-dependent methyltransferase